MSNDTSAGAARINYSSKIEGNDRIIPQTVQEQFLLEADLDDDME